MSSSSFGDRDTGEGHLKFNHVLGRNRTFTPWLISQAGHRIWWRTSSLKVSSNPKRSGAQRGDQIAIVLAPMDFALGALKFRDADAHAADPKISFESSSNCKVHEKPTRARHMNFVWGS